MSVLHENCVEPNLVSATKSPRAFGFLPTANADQNVTALQAVLKGGGLIVIDSPGVYELNNTILLDSDTRLVCAPGVIFKKVAPYCNVLMNRGALTKEYNENITIDGLEISVNGYEAMPTLVYGLRAQLGFFYIKNLCIKNFACLDGGASQFLIYIVTWEHLYVDNVRLAGDKDGIKLCNGHDAVIQNLDLTTYDDGLSLMGTDYPSVTLEVGSVYNVCYSNVTDHQYKNIFGRTCLINTGSWANYANGNEYRAGDLSLYRGKLYQCVNDPGFTSTSSVAPIHSTEVRANVDGISWRYIQDCDYYHADVCNVTFENCIFEKSGNLIAPWSVDGDYQRSFYPGTEKLSNVWGLSITNCKMKSSEKQVLVCVTGNLREVIISDCILDNLEAVIRMDYSAFIEILNASITGCVFKDKENILVAVHNGENVVDWALPFTQVGKPGFIDNLETPVKDGARVADNNTPAKDSRTNMMMAPGRVPLHIRRLTDGNTPPTVNCHLSGNSHIHGDAIFGTVVSGGTKLRVVNMDLPFNSLENLTPKIGDICRHVDGLFIYKSTGWFNLSA